MAIDKDYRFTLRGRKYSFETFCNANPSLTVEDAEVFIQNAINTGIAVEETDPMVNKTAKMFQDAEDVSEAYTVRENEVNDAVNERNIKNANLLKHKEVSFDFASYGNAKKFYDSVQQTIALSNEDVFFDGATNTVTLKGITDAELKKLAVIYNTQKVVRTTTNATNNTVRAATNIASYVAKDVAAPILKTGINATLSCAGSLFHTLIKTGSDVISTGFDCAKTTVHNISEDESYKKAKGDIKQAGAAIANKFGSFGGTSGITIK